jgi:hypothetical protein
MVLVKKEFFGRSTGYADIAFAHRCRQIADWFNLDSEFPGKFGGKSLHLCIIHIKSKNALQRQNFRQGAQLYPSLIPATADGGYL